MSSVLIHVIVAAIIVSFVSSMPTDNIFRFVFGKNNEVDTPRFIPEPMLDPPFRFGEWDPVDDTFGSSLHGTGLNNDEEESYSPFSRFFVPRGKRDLPHLCGIKIFSYVNTLCQGNAIRAGTVEISRKRKRLDIGTTCCISKCNDETLKRLFCKPV